MYELGTINTNPVIGVELGYYGSACSSDRKHLVSLTHHPACDPLCRIISLHK